MTGKRIASALAFVSLAILFTSCYEVTTLDLSSDLEITEDVSFAADVIPIFEKSCSLSGCHSANAIAPDLSSEKAFLSLTNGGYIDVENPKNSKLYGLVSGELQPAMPVSGADPLIAATVLAWIQQGAQNN